MAQRQGLRKRKAKRPCWRKLSELHARIKSEFTPEVMTHYAQAPDGNSKIADRFVNILRKTFYNERVSFSGYCIDLMLRDIGIYRMRIKGVKVSEIAAYYRVCERTVRYVCSRLEAQENENTYYREKKKGVIKRGYFKNATSQGPATTQSSYILLLTRHPVLSTKTP